MDKSWRVIIPLGLKIKIVERLKILAGTDLQFHINDSESSEDLVNHRKIYKKWENTNLIIDEKYGMK